MEVGDPRQMGSPTLVGNRPCFHTRSGVHHLRRLHGQPGWVTCLVGVHFPHVNT